MNGANEPWKTTKHPYWCFLNGLKFKFQVTRMLRRFPGVESRHADIGHPVLSGDILVLGSTSFRQCLRLLAQLDSTAISCGLLWTIPIEMITGKSKTKPARTWQPIKSVTVYRRKIWEGHDVTDAKNRRKHVQLFIEYKRPKANHMYIILFWIEGRITTLLSSFI